MEEFRRLLFERFILTMLFIVAAGLDLWAFSALDHQVAHGVKLFLNVVMFLVLVVLWWQIGQRRRRMLEIMGRGSDNPRR